MRSGSLVVRSLIAAALLLALALSVSGNQPRPTLPTQVQPEIYLDDNAKRVLEELGRIFGVTVEVDEELRRPVRLVLRDMDFAGALRIAAHLLDAFWTVRPDGSVVVAPDTPAKRQLYQPQLQQIFSLPGSTSEELTELARLLRELVEIRRIQINPERNTITIWDTPFRLAVAEELLQALRPEPSEVLVEVLLLEVDRDLARDLGVLPPDQVILVNLGSGLLDTTDLVALVQQLRNLIAQGVFPRALAPALEAGQIPPFVVLGGGRTLYAMNLPDTRLDLLELEQLVRSSQRITLRAQAGQEARFFSGERFPLQTLQFTAFSPEVQEISDLIRSSGIQFAELGFKLSLEPWVHPGREVTLKIKLTQQSRTAQELNGVPVLVTREVEERVRLREGESLLVGGLRSQTEQVSVQGWPLLGQIPLLGRLFRRTSTTERETEVFLLLQPRVIRLARQERFALRTLYIGTEREFASPTGPEPPPPQPAPPPTPQPPQPPELPQP